MPPGSSSHRETGLQVAGGGDHQTGDYHACPGEAGPFAAQSFPQSAKDAGRQGLERVGLLSGKPGGSVDILGYEWLRLSLEPAGSSKVGPAGPLDRDEMVDPRLWSVH